MSVITQRGDSPLMMAAREGRTDIVSLLVKAGANIYLWNKVNVKEFVQDGWISEEVWWFYCVIMRPLSTYMWYICTVL